MNIMLSSIRKIYNYLTKYIYNFKNKMKESAPTLSYTYDNFDSQEKLANKLLERYKKLCQKTF